MPDTPAHPGPDDVTAEFEPVSSASETNADSNATQEEETERADAGRAIRTWVWMILVAGFGIFLVFGSVSAHYWELNSRRTLIVPTTRGMQVLDIWRAQVNGLPDVAHQAVLKSVFLVSVFGFIGLSVIALWLATVEIRNAPAVDTNDVAPGSTTDGPAPQAASAPGASAG